jgi:hypothetical protein
MDREQQDTGSMSPVGVYVFKQRPIPIREIAPVLRPGAVCG